MTFKLKVIMATTAPHPHPPPRGGGSILLAAFNIIVKSLAPPTLVYL